MKRTYLTLIIMMLVIGFAAVATNLMISGKLNIGFNENDFEVYFSKATLDGEQSDNLITSDGKSIKFTSKVLTDIDSTSTLEYEITNNSKQYDAEVEVNCLPNELEYVNVENNLPSNKITAQTEETGTLTITLKTLTTEEHEETITCTLQVSAVSRTSVEEQKEEETYSIGAYLYDNESNILANKHLVVYSNTPHYVETDNEGYFYVEGLERGIHEIYYMQDKNPNELTKEEVKTQAIDEATVTTDAKKIEFENGEVKTEKESIGKEKDIIIVKVETNERTYDKVIEDGKTELEINKEGYTTILCNQKVELDENDKIEISKVTQDTYCKLYSSIADAVNDNNTNNSIGTIMMLNNDELNDGLNVFKRLYFNLNGKQIVGTSNDGLFDNFADATYYDSKNLGKIISKKYDVITISGSNVKVNTSINIEAARSAVRVYSGGTNSIINVTGGNIECNGDDLENHCIFVSTNTEAINITSAVIESIRTGIYNYGEVNLDNVNLIVDNGIAIENEGIISLNGGVYKSKKSYTIYNKKSGKTNINGEKATFDENQNYVSGTYLESTGSDQSVIWQDDGIVSINGGTIFHPYVQSENWRQHALRINSGIAYITGGELNTLGYVGQDANENLTYRTIFIEDNATLNVSGGEINGKYLVVEPDSILNVCGGKLNITLQTFATSKINYRSSGITWFNSSNTPVLFSNNTAILNADDNLTCTIN